MFAEQRRSAGGLEESAPTTAEASSKSAAKASTESASEAAPIVPVTHSIERVTHVHRLCFLGVVTWAVRGRDNRPLSRIGVPQIGQNLGHQIATQHIELRIGVVVAAFDDDWERLASHAGCDFEDLILSIGSQRGCAAHEVIQIDDEVDRLSVGLHGLVV